MRLPVYTSVVGKSIAEAEIVAANMNMILVIGVEDGEIVRRTPPRPGEMVVAVEQGAVVRVLSPKSRG